MKTENLWDIFCQVIDNYGDIGVCWRLATGLASRGERVRLWVDDGAALRWMAPQGAPGVEVRAWTEPLAVHGLEIGNCLIEAFGCTLPDEWIAAYARSAAKPERPHAWINLEYLSAEAYVERCHGLKSPVMAGPGTGLSKHFFYPGFGVATGGLLRETDLLQRQASFNKQSWLKAQGIEHQGEHLISLFCYEPQALEQLLLQLAYDRQQPTRLLVTHGRACAAVSACLERLNQHRPEWNQAGRLGISYLPPLSQRDYDHLLWACDLNFVRGEDSLVRALWANKPFVWHIYPQQDDAHHAKLQALLNRLALPPDLQTFHHIWNGVIQAELPPPDLDTWQKAVSQARSTLLQQDELVTQIIGFARNTTKI